MYFDPFTARRIPVSTYPKEQCKCWKCGLRFVNHYRELPQGSGLCRYCEAATKRIDAPRF